MKLLLTLCLIPLITCNFFLKINTEEKCLVDSFVKNQEAIIKLEISDFEKNSNFEFFIIIKDIALGYSEVQRFVFKNERKRSFIYTHISTGDAAVCLVSNVELYVNVRLDVNIQLPENLIDKNDMQELENTIYQSVTSMADFNRGQKELGATGGDNLAVL